MQTVLEICAQWRWFYQGMQCAMHKFTNAHASKTFAENSLLTNRWSDVCQMLVFFVRDTECWKSTLMAFIVEVTAAKQFQALSLLHSKPHTNNNNSEIYYENNFDVKLLQSLFIPMKWCVTLISCLLTNHSYALWNSVFTYHFRHIASHVAHFQRKTNTFQFVTKMIKRWWMNWMGWSS